MLNNHKHYPKNCLGNLDNYCDPMTGKGAQIKKFNDAMKLRPITHEINRNMDDNPKDAPLCSTKTSRKIIHCNNGDRVPIIRKSVTLDLPVDHLKEHFITDDNMAKQESSSSRTILNDNILSENNPKSTEQPTTISFQLPTENSFHQVNKFFKSVKGFILSQKISLSNYKSKWTTLKLNKTNIDIAKLQLIELKQPNTTNARTLQCMFPIKSYNFNKLKSKNDNNLNKQQTQELLFKYESSKNVQKLPLEEDAMVLKSKINEGEKIELLPLLTIDEFKLRLGISDVMFLE